MTFSPATLGQIAADIGASMTGDPTATVSNVTHDSRQAGEGTLFTAIRGLTMDGHRFVEDVMRRGAVGVISEAECPAGFSGAWLRVGNARAAMARVASVVFGAPSREIELVGITGTKIHRMDFDQLLRHRLGLGLFLQETKHGDSGLEIVRKVAVMTGGLRPDCGFKAKMRALRVSIRPFGPLLASNSNRYRTIRC